MPINRKSYIERKPLASYKPPSQSAERDNSRRSSFFNKIKSFFNNEEDRKKDENLGAARSSKATVRSTSAYNVPGGFYDSQAAAERSAILSKTLGNRTADSTFADEFEDEDPNISNAKLASFFKDKGDRPLTDIEMEGVISVMKRCRSVSSTPFGSRIISDSKSIPSNNILRTTSEVVPKPLKASSYTPRFEESHDGNNSLRSTRSSVTRRIFDYSRMPSPYRTTVYKYSAASVPGKGAPDVLQQTNETKNKVTRNRNSTKRLSNTASALMSILDGDKEKNGRSKASIASNLANPYASHVSRVRKSKPTSETSEQPITPSKPVHTVVPDVVKPSTGPSGLNPSSKITSTLNTGKAEGKDDSNTSSHTKSVSNETSTNQYKPNVSSSLRQAVTAEMSPSKETETKKLEEGSLPKDAKTASSFSFTFQRPEPFDIPTFDTDSVRKHQQTQPKTFSFGKIESPEIVEPEVGIVEGQVLNHTGNGLNKGCDDFIRTDTRNLEPFKEYFTFDDVSNSAIDPKSIDHSKVEKFKSMFIF